jgi:hypothetical protein
MKTRMLFQLTNNDVVACAMQESKRKIFLHKNTGPPPVDYQMTHSAKSLRSAGIAM